MYKKIKFILIFSYMSLAGGTTKAPLGFSNHISEFQKSEKKSTVIPAGVKVIELKEPRELKEFTPSLKAVFGWNSVLVDDSVSPHNEIGGFDHWPHVVRDGYGYLWAVYSASKGTGYDGDTIWVLYSQDNGNTWYLKVMIYRTGDTTYGVFTPFISVNRGDNYIYISNTLAQKSSYTHYPGDIYVTRFQHIGGGNIQNLNTTQITTYTGIYVIGVVSADGDSSGSPYVYLACLDWVNFYIDYYRSSDYGLTFDLVNMVALGSYMTSAIDAAPKYGNQGAFFSYVHWNGSTYDIWVAEVNSTSNLSFSAINYGTNSNLRWPVDVAWYGNKGIVFFTEWQAYTNGNTYYLYNDGTGWSSLITFEATTENTQFPAVDIDETGRIFLAVFKDSDNDYWGRPYLYVSTDHINWTNYYCYSDTVFDTDVMYYNPSQFLTYNTIDIVTSNNGIFDVPNILWRRVSGATNEGDVWSSYTVVTPGGVLQHDTLGFIYPDSSIDYQIKIINTGALPDTFSLVTSYTKPGWTAEILNLSYNPINKIFVPCGDTAFVILRITSPLNAVAGTRDTTYLISSSFYNSQVRDSVQAITEILGFIIFQMEPDTSGSVIPGDSIIYNMRIINSGNVRDSIVLTKQSTSQRWSSQIVDTLGNPIDYIIAQPYSMSKFKLKVIAPDTALIGESDTIVVKGISTFDLTKGDSAIISTSILGFANIMVEPDTTGSVMPDSFIDYSIRIFNRGNILDTIKLSTFGTRNNWNAQILDSTATTPLSSVILSPYHGKEKVILRITSPVLPFSGEADTTFIVGTSSFDSTVREQARVISVVNLIADIDVYPDTVINQDPGTTVLYKMNVFNGGNITDNITISVISNKGWVDSQIKDDAGNPIPNNQVQVNTNTSTSFYIEVTVPPLTPALVEDTVIVRGVSGNIPSVSDIATVIIRVNKKIISLFVEPDQKQRIPSGTSYSYPLYVILNSNSEDVIEINSPPPPRNWSFELVNIDGTPLPQSITLSPGDTFRFYFKVKAPEIKIVGSPQDIEDSILTVINALSTTSSVQDIANITTVVIPKLDVHNFPSPFKFNDKTTFIFSLPEKGKVTLTLYNRLGEKIKTVISEKEYPAGIHYDLKWDGRNDRGDRVAPGVYIYIFKFVGKNRKEIIKKKTVVY